MPVPLISEADLRTWFEISKSIEPIRFNMPIGAASRRLRSWVGDAVYTATDNTERVEDLKFAEAHLAMHFVLLNLNTVLRPGGVVEEERVEGDTTIRYLTPAKTKELSAAYLEQAEEITRPYMTSDGTPDAPFEIAEDED